MSEDPVARQIAGEALTYEQQSVATLGSQVSALSTGVVVSAAYSASSGQIIDADTSAGSFTVTLPASGGTIAVRDHAGTWGTNPVTIAGNGPLIDGQTSFLLDAPGFQVIFTLIDAEWRFTMQFLNGAA